MSGALVLGGVTAAQAASAAPADVAGDTRKINENQVGMAGKAPLHTRLVSHLVDTFTYDGAVDVSIEQNLKAGTAPGTVTVALNSYHMSAFDLDNWGLIPDRGKSNIRVTVKGFDASDKAISGLGWTWNSPDSMKQDDVTHPLDISTQITPNPGVRVSYYTAQAHFTFDDNFETDPTGNSNTATYGIDYSHAVVTLVSSTMYPSRGGTVTLTARVPNDATGEVVFADNTHRQNQEIARVPIANGDAKTTFTLPITSTGTVTYTATYQGDHQYNPETKGIMLTIGGGH